MAPLAEWMGQSSWSGPEAVAEVGITGMAHEKNCPAEGVSGGRGTKRAAAAATKRATTKAVMTRQMNEAGVNDNQRQASAAVGQEASSVYFKIFEQITPPAQGRAHWPLGTISNRRLGLKSALGNLKALSPTEILEKERNPPSGGSFLVQILSKNRFLRTRIKNFYKNNPKTKNKSKISIYKSGIGVI
jgi:hypothetical protein